MAKNPRRAEKLASQSKTPFPAARRRPLISKRGKKVIGLGVGGVVLGFWILTYTDPAGQNWASTLSPALLVLGYALIGVGIVLPDPVPTLSSTSSPQN